MANGGLANAEESNNGHQTFSSHFDDANVSHDEQNVSLKYLTSLAFWFRCDVLFKDRFPNKFATTINSHFAASDFARLLAQRRSYNSMTKGTSKGTKRKYEETYMENKPIAQAHQVEKIAILSARYELAKQETKRAKIERKREKEQFKAEEGKRQHELRMLQLQLQMSQSRGSFRPPYPTNTTNQQSMSDTFKPTIDYSVIYFDPINDLVCPGTSSQGWAGETATRENDQKGGNALLLR